MSHFVMFSDTKDGTIKELEQEKRLLMAETGKVKALYKDLNIQLESMQKVFEHKHVRYTSRFQNS